MRTPTGCRARKAGDRHAASIRRFSSWYPNLLERIMDSQDHLGECPLWDERTQSLWWVDIHAPAIKRFDGGSVTVIPMPQYVGSNALRVQGGLLATLQSGLHLIEKEAPRLFSQVVKPRVHRHRVALLLYSGWKRERAARRHLGAQQPRLEPR